jgi:hypothetical protein
VSKNFILIYDHVNLINYVTLGELRRIIEDSYQKALHEKYGKIMKISGLPGGKNMLFVFDPDEIEKVSLYM